MNDINAVPGMTVVVTGGTGGIGLATSRRLAETGARIVVAGRDRSRGQAAVARLVADGAADATFVAADLSSLEATRKAAAEVRALVGRPDILVANAGGLYPSRWTTVDGHEASLAMNLLSPFLFATEVLSGPGRSRLVVVATSVIARVRADFGDPQSERRYRGLDVYGRTKLYGAAALLDLAADRHDIDIVLADPGGAATEMTAGMTPGSMPPVMRLAWPLFRVVQSRMTAERAARSSVAAATDRSLASGTWLSASAKQAAMPKPLRDATARSRSRALAEQLLAQGTSAAHGG